MKQDAPLLTMLAIDDELTIQQIIKYYFRNDFTVITKDNGSAALSWMQEGNIPDVIVVDFDMPHMNGLSFISQVRSSGYLRNTPVLMLSGSVDSNMKIQCLESGADDFLFKPFNPRELAARLNGIIRRNLTNYHVKATGDVEVIQVL